MFSTQKSSNFFKPLPLACQEDPRPAIAAKPQLPTVALSFRRPPPYIQFAELRGACRINIPGALSISEGAVPGLARGLGHTAPTYLVGSRDRHPTAIAAPRSHACFLLEESFSLPQNQRLERFPHLESHRQLGLPLSCPLK